MWPEGPDNVFGIRRDGSHRAVTSSKSPLPLALHEQNHNKKKSRTAGGRAAHHRWVTPGDPAPPGPDECYKCIECGGEHPPDVTAFGATGRVGRPAPAASRGRQGAGAAPLFEPRATVPLSPTKAPFPSGLGEAAPTFSSSELNAERLYDNPPPPKRCLPGGKAGGCPQ